MNKDEEKYIRYHIQRQKEDRIAQEKYSKRFEEDWEDMLKRWKRKVLEDKLKDLV